MLRQRRGRFVGRGRHPCLKVVQGGKGVIVGRLKPGKQHIYQIDYISIKNNNLVHVVKVILGFELINVTNLTLILTNFKKIKLKRIGLHKNKLLIEKLVRWKRSKGSEQYNLFREGSSIGKNKTV